MQIKILRSLFLVFFFLSAFLSYGQESILDKKIDFSENDVTLNDIIHKLEKKLNVTFSYANDLINLDKRFSIQVTDQLVSEVLRRLFPSDAFKFRSIGNKIVIYKRPVRYTISGYITEFGTGEHLSDVSVYIPELQTGITTNTYGFYSISLPQANHQVYISLLGYETMTKQVNLNQDLNLNIELVPIVEYLDEVIVNVSGEDGVSEITQMSFNNMKNSYFQDVPVLLGEKDVIKTLQLLPGVKSGNDGSAGFYVRGGAPDQNLIILDESIVYNSNHLFGFFSIFNGDAIKSVDIYKGGFPARYGGRLSSVIQIDTKDGNKEQLEGKINVGLITSSFTLEGPLKKEKTSFLISGRRTYADLLSLPFQADSDNRVLYHFSDLNFKLHHIIDQKNKLFWSNYYGIDKFSIEENLDELEGENQALISWGNITSTLRWNHQFTNKLFANTSLIFSNYVFKSSNEDNFEEDPYYYENRTGINDYGIKLDFDYYPTPDHTVKFGLASTYHDFTPKRTEFTDIDNQNQIFVQKIRSLESALYVEDDWQLTNKLSIYPGLRLSHFQFKSSGYFRPELRMATAYKFNSTTAIKFSYVKMNQFIHRLSNTGLGLPTDLWVSSTDQYDPQSSQQVALGFAKDFNQNMYSFTVETYYKKMNDLLEYKEGVSYINVNELENSEQVDFTEDLTSGQGWAYGIELLLRKRKGPLTGWLGYTLSWSERQFAELNAGKRFRDRYDRRHDISLVGVYKPSEKITLSGSWVFSSGINFNVPQYIGIPPNDNLPIIDLFPGDSYEFSSQKNNFKGEDHHRLDLGIQFHKKKKNRERTWGFSFYNVYARKNPFFYAVSEDEDQGRKTLQKLSIFQFIPSFNYSLKF
ncbi:TonB-dependent receptor domain-containing protein [Aquimarina brevivitae]|uniref:Outer membrane receptor for ferrienterochelin and colicin n=1 Tax=Aquimarina brevivitae TaxID=323412 RepID=A0A4Q7P2F8_9FLAO|nr:TonB-dependent receptor [Aquimarina brevivitae]RZS93528.1 outer membrane receptor for ferrienterochelin and colicin [Aquimarina brevivitae]